MRNRTEAATRLQHRWRAILSQRMSRTLTELRRLSECVVCGDECVQCVRCPNNHACCVSCHTNMSVDSRCPMCREPRRTSPGKELNSILLRSGIRFTCPNCGTHSSSEDHERHRAWCPKHEFLCPMGTCTQHFTVDQLVDHALTHGAQRVDYDPFVVSLVRGDTLFFLVDDVLVVLTSSLATHRRFGSLELSPNVPLCMHAYYPSPHHPPFGCTILHHSMTSYACDGSYSERIALATIPPMLASHEHIVLSNRVPVIVPFCSQTGIQQGPLTSMVYTRHDDRSTIVRSLRRHGIRDLPLVTDPFASPDPNRLVGLVTLRFQRNDTCGGTVGTLFTP